MTDLKHPASKWLLLLGTNLAAEDPKAEGNPVSQKKIHAWLEAAGPAISRADCEAKDLPVLPGRSSDWIAHRATRRTLLASRLTDLANQGIKATTVFEDDYPKRLKDNLGEAAPPFLFYAGDLRLASNGRIIGFVGSRNAEQDTLDATAVLATSCAESKITVCSGGARGVDRSAEDAAIEVGGTMVMCPVEGLAHVVRKKRFRKPMTDEQMLCLSTVDPSAGWHVGQAMARNSLIYAMSTLVCVMHAGKRSGGTWSGATAALERKMTVVATWEGEGHGSANSDLEQEGAIPITETTINGVIKQLRNHASKTPNHGMEQRTAEQALLLGRKW